MELSQKKSFSPITIVLETEHEARSLATIINWSAWIWDHVEVTDNAAAASEIEEVSSDLNDLLIGFVDPYEATETV